MTHKTPKKPNEYLDRCTQRLAERHHQRLQAMTCEAINALPKKRVMWGRPVLASVFTLAIIATTLFLQDTEKVTSDLPAISPATLPAWVMDTKTPETLIENLDFYDWLIQQTEDPVTINQKHVIMDIAKLYQSRLSQRLATDNIAQRLSRTTAYIRNVQK